MGTITPINASSAGTPVTFVAAISGGDTLAAGLRGGCVFHVRNGGGASITLTMAGAKQCNQGGTHNAPFVIAAGAEEAIDVPDHCVDASGNVAITYTAVTTVTVAAVIN